MPSKQALSALCFDKPAELHQLKSHDRYGRTVARVTCNGIDANAAQVRNGFAWAYTVCLTDPSIKAAETQARIDRAGLWGDPEPVPPWEWRRQR